jgi:hypothetical protein
VSGDPSFSALHRRFALGLAVALAMAVPGCVLPVGPEFEEEKNAPPFVVSSSPPVGSAVTAINQVFEVTVQDPNRIDTLYARWLIDFPPFNQEISRTVMVPPQPASNPDLPNLQRLRFTPSCTKGDPYALSPSLSHHRLMLVVSDRQFLEGTLIGTPPDAFTVQLTWTFDRDCFTQ